MSESTLTSLALDDWFEAYQPPATPRHQPTSSESHPHPLRSHSKDLKRFPESDERPGRPDSCILPHSRANGALHGTTIIPMADITIPPLPTYNNREQSNVFRHNVTVPSSPKDFPIVATRPPLRPSTSFGGSSLGSYSSYASAELERKSMRVATEEIFDTRQHKASTRRFHGCLVLLCFLNIMSGLNTTSLATALPSMSRDLRTGPVSTFWIATSSLLTSALFQPLFMRLSAVDSKLLLTLGLVLITSGSLVSALAGSSIAIIVGRSIEGCGNAAVRVLTQLILNQLITDDARRGCEKWIPTAFWFGAAIGPIVGGAFTQTAGWPYIFYINIPFALVGGALIPLLVRLPEPTESTWQRVKKVDVLGWTLLSAAFTPIVLGISWAGSVHSWSSWPVLVPLLAGTATLATWAVYSHYRRHPILPLSSLARASVITPCIGTITHGMLFAAILYMAAIHFQSGLSLSILFSGIYLLSWSIPFFLVTVAASSALPVSNHRLASSLGWILATIGLAMTTFVTSTSSPVLVIAIGVLTGATLGLLAPVLRSAIQQSTTTDDETIHAGPMHSFFSSLGMCFGVAVASSIYLDKRDQGQDVTSSLRLVWIVLTVFSSTTLMISIFSTIRVYKTPGRIELRLVGA